MEQSEKQLVKFVCPPSYYIIVGVFAMIGFVIVGIYSRVFVHLVIWSLCGAGFFIYMSVYEYAVPYLRMRMMIKEAKLKGEDLVLLDDFRKAGRAFGGTLILGERFVIAKESGSIYRYDEIDRIFRVIQTSYGRSISHMLYIYDRKGRKRKLCVIFPGNYDKSELHQVYAYFAMKNKHIKIGEI